MGDGQLDDVKELVLKLAAIAAHVDQRNRAGVQYIESSGHMLDDAARRLQSGADQFANAVMQSVGRQVRGVVAEHSAAALDRFNEQLRASTGRVQWATEAMAEQRKLLNAAQRILVWKGLTALLIGAVLAAIAAGVLFWQVRSTGGDPSLAADVRQAIATGALARCNGGALCARTAAVPHNGKTTRNEYIVVH